MNVSTSTDLTAIPTKGRRATLASILFVAVVLLSGCSQISGSDTVAVDAPVLLPMVELPGQEKPMPTGPAADAVPMSLADVGPSYCDNPAPVTDAGVGASAGGLNKFVTFISMGYLDDPDGDGKKTIQYPDWIDSTEVTFATTHLAQIELLGMQSMIGDPVYAMCVKQHQADRDPSCNERVEGAHMHVWLYDLATGALVAQNPTDASITCDDIAEALKEWTVPGGYTQEDFKRDFAAASAQALCSEPRAIPEAGFAATQPGVVAVSPLTRKNLANGSSEPGRLTHVACASFTVGDATNQCWYADQFGELELVIRNGVYQVWVIDLATGELAGSESFAGDTTCADEESFEYGTYTKTKDAPPPAQLYSWIDSIAI